MMNDMPKKICVQYYDQETLWECYECTTSDNVSSDDPTYIRADLMDGMRETLEMCRRAWVILDHTEPNHPFTDELFNYLAIGFELEEMNDE